MFNKDESRIIIILGLLGALSCIVSVFFLSGMPTLEFKFPLAKEKIFKIADEFLNQQHISSQPLVKKSHVSSDEGSIVYLQKTLGIDKTKNLLESLPLYYWQIDYTYQKNKNIILFSRNKTNLIRLIVSPTKERIIGFRRFIPPDEYDSAQILSKDKSERIANDFFSLINFDISNFRMTRYTPLEKRYTFEWEKDILEIKKAKLKVKLEIFGDKVGNFSYFLEIPPSELKKYLSNSSIDLILFISLNAGIFVLGIFTLVISIIRRRRLKWKFGLVFALLISPTFYMGLFKFGGYRGIYTAIA